MIGEHKLEISGIEVIYSPQKGSQRWQQNWITSTDPTARGITVVKGVNARLPIYRWQVKAQMPYWKALRLDRLNRKAQRLLGEGSNDGKITLWDSVHLVDSDSATQSGRQIIPLSTFTYKGESGSYCKFLVELILPSSFSNLLQNSVSSDEQMESILDVNFDLKEF